MNTTSAASAIPRHTAAAPGGLYSSSSEAPALGATLSFSKDEEIYAEGERAGYFYRVLSGAVRTCKLLADGRRQIENFYVAGDVFGIELGSEHRFTAEAVGDATVVAYRRCGLDAIASGDGQLGRLLVGALMRNLERAQEHLMLLGRKTAMERIASFLLDMAERSPSAVLDLPMSRTDIADHLGLTIETVSRSLTQLEREGVIAVPAGRRTIVLRDRAALRRLDG